MYQQGRTQHPAHVSGYAEMRVNHSSIQLRLMRRDPQTARIPIVMISGNEAATEQFYANRIGADDFMKKPFSRYEVFSRIERLLDSEQIPRRKSNEKAAQPQ